MSADLCLSLLASNCLVQDMPNSDVVGLFSRPFSFSVKYEKSSTELKTSDQRQIEIEMNLLLTYVCDPSASAIKGSRDQSLSTAGSVPSSAPSHSSTSGPLSGRQG